MTFVLVDTLCGFYYVLTLCVTFRFGSVSPVSCLGTLLRWLHRTIFGMVRDHPAIVWLMLLLYVRAYIGYMYVGI